MNDFLATEKYLNNTKFKQSQNAKKILEKYIDQLKLHFDLNDEDIVKVLESTIKSRKNRFLIKKWWQIWK